MSIALMSGVFAAGPEDAKQRLVLLSLADGAGHDGGAYLDVEATAAKCAMSVEETRRILDELRALGWITGSSLRPIISGIRMGVDEP